MIRPVLELMFDLTGRSKPLLLIGVLAVISGGILSFDPPQEHSDLEVWVFAEEHARSYRDTIITYADRHDLRINLLRVDIQALMQRVRSGLYSGTPVADVFELEYATAGQLFRGPPENLGLVAFDELLSESGLLEQINPPSLAAWQHGGKQLGLPHDVHPVGLIVRQDILDHHSISLDDVETWEDFFRTLAPIANVDADADGRPDHYAISYWPTQSGYTELLIRQAGGRLFDENGRPSLSADPAPKVLAHAVSWCVGNQRFATEIPDFTDTGNRRKVRGDAIAYFAPDWMTAVWRREMPENSGKVRVIPMPAWEPGGRRTSVYGGTMLAIPSDNRSFDHAWELAQEMYFSVGPAERTWKSAGVLSPITSLWSEPFYHEPDEYFQGQQIGSLYIELAPTVPPRAASPYLPAAQSFLQSVGVRLLDIAREQNMTSPKELEPIARELLQAANEQLDSVLERNPFLAEITEQAP
ncbi:MAG: ABC transporter substrate-binding protein [Planctomycetota bacterium]